jgi:DNA (cytosine-5)-methyltransferase 1
MIAECTEDSQPHIVNRIRRLTPIECARLQGFPDDWCSELSDTQAYKCYGNAVSVPVVEEIGKRLLKDITE